MDVRPELLSRPLALRHLRWLVAVGAVACLAFLAYSRAPQAVAAQPDPFEASSPDEQESAGVAGNTDRPPVMPVTPSAPPISTPASPAPSATQPATSAPGDAATYQTSDLLLALVPALVAIFLAIITRQVIVALSAGILIAAGIVQWLDGVWNPIHWIMFAVDRYLFDVLAPLADDGSGVDLDHMKIIIFTLFIGAMIGVIEANGGTRAMVARVTRRVATRQKGQLSAFLAGIMVFFDDYANAMIVGPSMRPIFDRLRLSREKLAYIVDSTAAPVASLFIGTWLAFEIAQLDEGFDALGSDVPGFLSGVTGTTAFWASIPYRTYALLALVMVFLVAVTGRDFGSMRKAESRAAAAAQADPKTHPVETSESGERWWLGFVPVFVLVAMVIGLLVYSGWCVCHAEGTTLAWGGVRQISGSLTEILGNADSYPALVYGSLCAAVVAVLLSVLSRALPLAATMDGVVLGMSKMFAACIILVLAWGLSQGGKDLGLGGAAGAFLQQESVQQVFSVTYLPLAIFITAGVVSFSTGTSYGTMAILCPVVIPVAAGMLGSMAPAEATPLFYACVGAVLTGAVFGDHCSPISDTTVLSSIATGCELSKHVWTQLPYALTVALVGILSMDGLNFAIEHWMPQWHEAYRGWSWAWGLATGTVMLLLVLLIFGRRPKRVVVEPTIEIGHSPA